MKAKLMALAVFLLIFVACGSEGDDDWYDDRDNDDEESEDDKESEEEEDKDYFNIDTSAFCSQYVGCCHDVGKAYCDYDCYDEKMQEVCESEMEYKINRELEKNENHEVCNEWYRLQGDFLNCAGTADLNCDEWIGKDQSSDAGGDLANYGKICEKRCNSLRVYNEFNDLSDCGSLIFFAGMKGDIYSCVFAPPSL